MGLSGIHFSGTGERECQMESCDSKCERLRETVVSLTKREKAEEADDMQLDL